MKLFSSTFTEGQILKLNQKSENKRILEEKIIIVESVKLIPIICTITPGVEYCTLGKPGVKLLAV